MNNPVKVSIVVATKDRYETLFYCIESLLINYDRPDVEIIVRDNSSKPQINEFKARFGTRPNIVYQQDHSPVSQSENYELGVALARGEYLTMIGDDDGVASGLIEVVDWMKRHSLDAFFPGFAVYLWPGVNGRLTSINSDGLLQLANWSAPRMIDPELQRRAVLESGSTSLHYLPRMYYGLVRRSCIERLRSEAGSVFPGPSPDMANAFALSYVVNRAAVGEMPLFIAGNSNLSNAGLGLRGMHVGEISELVFLPKNTTDLWNPCIPFFWSGQTIWCQSAYTASKALGLAQEFEVTNNYRALYSRVLVFHTHFTNRLMLSFFARHRQSSKLKIIKEFFAILNEVAELWFTRITSFLHRRFNLRSKETLKYKHINNLPTILDATICTDAAISKINLGNWLDLQMQSTSCGRASNTFNDHEL